MINSLDVACANCGALPGVACRAWSRMLAPMRRVHRSRSRRRDLVVQMHTAVERLAFADWPPTEEVESIATLGEGDDQSHATKLLSLIEATGYEGELFCTT